MIKEEHKEAIIKIISAFYPDAKIYLFGSYAYGTNQAGSDIDIAFDIGREATLKEQSFLWNLLDALPTSQKIDLVDMHTIPENMRQDILTKGVLWKS